MPSRDGEHLSGWRVPSFLILRSRTSILRCFVFSETLRLLFGMSQDHPRTRARAPKTRYARAGVAAQTVRLVRAWFLLSLPRAHSCDVLIG